jgi:DNA-binding transcriptional LysR family regulator
MMQITTRDRSFDLRLMRLGQILLSEASVSRTALRTGQSQPSVSLALKRLRAITGDPLLVRSGARLVPTERGTDLLGVLTRILDDIDRVLDAGEAFDPARTTRPIKLLAVNCFGAFLMPRIVELLRDAAPNATVDFLKMPEDDKLVRPLESGEVDLVIGNWPVPPASLRCAPLFDNEIACMVRTLHPYARRAALKLDEYLALDHLSPTPYSSASVSPIDGRLAQLGLKRKIRVSVPEYTVVPYMLASNDLVFTSGRSFIEHMASIFPFAVLDAPEELGSMRFYMLWHERSHRASFGRWLRGIVRKAASELDAIRPAAPLAADPVDILEPQ